MPFSVSAGVVWNTGSASCLSPHWRLDGFYSHDQDHSLNSSGRYARESGVAPRGTIGLNTGFRMYAQLCYSWTFPTRYSDRGCFGKCCMWNPGIEPCFGTHVESGTFVSSAVIDASVLTSSYDMPYFYQTFHQLLIARKEANVVGILTGFLWRQLTASEVQMIKKKSGN